MKRYISTKFKTFLTENSSATFDKMVDLEKWYEIEKGKLDTINNFKEWDIKSERLFKQYLKYKNKLTKLDNPFGLEGDLTSKYLYHYTNADGLERIIENNEMIGDTGGISFTTHPNLYKRGFIFTHPNKYYDGRTHNNIGIKMKFDFKSMKKDGYKFRKGNEDMGTHVGEDEVRLRTSEFENPLEYLLEVIVFKDKEPDYKHVVEILVNKNIKYKVV